SFVLGKSIAPFADIEVFDQLHGFAPGRLGDLVESTFGEPGGHSIAVTPALGLLRVGGFHAEPPADTDGAAACMPVFEAQRGGVSDSVPGGLAGVDEGGVYRIDPGGRLLGRPKHDPGGLIGHGRAAYTIRRTAR